VLLGKKKRGFGLGKWNGFGGKVEPNESIEQAAWRELKEEAGIEAIDLKPLGLILFEFENDPKLLEVHVFTTTTFKGEPTESDEMQPQWWRYDEIPYDQMWKDDAIWFPLLFGRKYFVGYFLFRGYPDEAILKQHVLQLNEEEFDNLDVRYAKLESLVP